VRLPFRLAGAQPCVAGIIWADANHMERRSWRERMRCTMAALRRLLKRNEPEPPDDPYAMVTAPRKPRPPHRSAAVADEPER